jgi:solute carrier family 25 citrate transporter 1
VRNTLKTGGVTALYSGCGALVVGNGLKAGVRFMTYDSIKELLRDPEVSLGRSPGGVSIADGQGKLSPGRTMLAGLGAGIVEATVAVTPSETIK